jgi:transketolase
MAALVSTRMTYGKALVELGKTNPDIVALSADVSNSDHSYMFQEAFPERFINVGIAEQALVDVAVGMAYTGKIPFVNTFAFLFATRALEMIRTHVCIGKANVKLMACYCGLSPCYEGPTHHAICDVAIIRSLPNITVVCPGDPLAIKKLLPQVAEWPGPVYFRMNRNEVPQVFDESYEPRIGEAVSLRTGRDVTLIASGIMVGRCLEAHETLKKEGIDAAVLEVHTIKPLDKDRILEAAKKTAALVTAEEHTVLGGLGSAVAELITTHFPVPIKMVGIADTFADSGAYFDMLDRFGMSVHDIVRAAREAIAAKNGNK